MSIKTLPFPSADQSVVGHIVGFTGRYRWLALDESAEVEWQGMKYPTVEHALLASGIDNDGVRGAIAGASVQEARRIAKKAPKNYDLDIASDRIDVLAQLLLQKFATAELRKKLLDTGNARLVNKNDTGDTILGVCNQRGYNVLGKTLEAVRDTIRQQASMKFSRGE